MEFTLDLKQDLKLILTQEMKLSLNVLEMSVNDLEKFILKEKELNPLIEVDFSNKFNKKSSNDDEDFSPLELAHKEESLIDYLEEQLGYLSLSKNLKFLCSYIINNLDKRGYLPLSKKEIKNFTGFSLKDTEEALKIVKNFEPIGICASNLEECLIIQLHKKNINDMILENLIKYFLIELSEGKNKEICRKLKISEEKLKEYLDEIRKLNPIPARGFYMGDNINFIIPEAEIKKVGEKYIVSILEENLPKIKIKSIKNEENRNFYNSAINLINFIEKRRETLKNILELILEKQYDFFSKKDGKLKKFTSKEAAEILNLHQSTISRAIKNKYILSDKGILRIKDLFVLNGLKEEICDLIEEVILNEDREKPYTDQYISEYLENKGISIARRTVAKYREELGIKPTSKRRIKGI
ncbi:RNA polymerase factor sigma-54 [Fusobacterium sp.]|uniref:RNA polymerase factor sigma-54 n=1 Tax=Fusobacterium sp. TaxID=68766 RepID=UPI002612D1BA|nr:RNA polymerase factor sigma-54 [Fusobacterium sp.]